MLFSTIFSPVVDVEIIVQTEPKKSYIFPYTARKMVSYFLERLLSVGRHTRGRIFFAYGIWKIATLIEILWKRSEFCAASHSPPYLKIELLASSR